MKRKSSIVIILFFAGVSSLFAQATDAVNALLLNYNSEYEKRSFSANVSELNRILGIARKQADDTGTCNVYRRLGIVYKNNGDLKKAITCYTQSLQISDGMGYHIASGSTCNNIAFIYYSLGEVAKTIEYLQKSLGHFEKENFYQGIADAGGSLSELYSEKEDWGKATNYAEKSMEARRKMQDTADIGYLYHTLGFLEYKQGNGEKAKKYYRQAISHITGPDIIPSVIGLANTFSAQKNIDSSLYYLHMAYDSAYKYQYIPFLAQALAALSATYEAAGDTLNAFKYLKLQRTVADSLLDSATVKAVIDAERRYDSQSKTREIAYQKAEIKNKNLLIVIITIILASIAAVAFLVVKNSLNKKQLTLKEAELQRNRINELLQQQEVVNVNAQLKGQDAERKRIAQELHDRLGSILATVKLHFTNVEESINALKQQQTKSYKEANQLLDEACEEVRRISHDLYEGSLAKFGFRTALMQLIAAIEKANALKINFLDNNVPETTYKNVEKDLYRITQELLSNTLKYAEATQVTIQLTAHPANFVYTYEDDGKGFNPATLPAAAGIGYKNLEARVENMGGTWHVDSRPGHGMTVVIEIPLNHGAN